MAPSENLFDIIALGKCEVPYTKNQYTLKRSNKWPPTHFFTPVQKVNIALTKCNSIKKFKVFRDSENYAISK